MAQSAFERQIQKASARLTHPDSPVGIAGNFDDLQAIIEAVGPKMAEKPGSVAAVAGLALRMLSPEETASVTDQHLRQTGKPVTIFDLLPR